MANLTEKVKDSVLTQIQELPLDLWFFEKCKTQDQQANWVEINQSYRLLEMELKSYFEGTRSPLQDYPKATREIAYYWARSYIALYDCLRLAWDHIVEYASKYGISIRETPGDTLVEIIRNDCLATLNTHHRFFQCRPRKTYDLYREDAQIAALRTKPNKSKPELRRIERYDKKVTAIYQKYDGLCNLRLFCYTCSVAHAKNSIELNDAVRHYEATQRKLDATITRSFHPSQGQKGFDVIKGIRKPVS